MTRFVRADDVLWRASGEQVVILPRDEHEPLCVSGSGVALWEVLAQPISVDGAAEAVGALYSVSVARVAEQIAPVLEDLRRRGAVTCSR